MGDIVERLRNYIPGENEEYIPDRIREAADVIEQLRRDLSHAKAVQEVWIGRTRRLEAPISPVNQPSAEAIENKGGSQ
jgi:hypothetical protein